jgi:imidazolonepropionase-like amidohydrolase
MCTVRLYHAVLFFLLSLCACLCACKPSESPHPRAIVGAIMLDGQGGPPVSDSVVVVSDGLIAAAGPSSSVTVPQGAETVDGAARYLIPTPVDVCGQATLPDMLHASTPEEARAQVEKLIGAHATVIHTASLAAPVAQAAMEAARAKSIPVIAHISTEAEAETMLAAGASGFVGIMRDREVDPAFAARLRDLRIFFAPALSSSAEGIEIAKHNTLRLFQAGVPIALASMGGNYLHEAELLAESGIPPLDVLVAATRNGAAATGKLATLGTIQPGKVANLLLLSANPGEDIHNLRLIVTRINSSVWTR